MGVLLYERDGDVLDLYHTEVPPAYRGKGVAAHLAQAAFKYIQQNNLKMILTCTYLQHHHTSKLQNKYTDYVVK